MGILTQRVTLADPHVMRTLNDAFVCTSFNYDRPDFTALPRMRSLGTELTARDARNLTNGYGSGQVTLFICLSDGRVLHRLNGFVHPEMLRAELQWGLELFAGATRPGTARDALAVWRGSPSRSHAELRRALSHRIRKLDGQGDPDDAYPLRMLNELTPHFLAPVEPQLLGIHSSSSFSRQEGRHQ